MAVNLGKILAADSKLVGRKLSKIAERRRQAGEVEAMALEVQADRLTESRSIITRLSVNETADRLRGNTTREDERR